MISEDESVLLALQRANHRMLEAVAAELGDLRLPASEFNVLANLAGRDGLTVSALASAVGSRATTMTSTLDRLQRRGYLRRQPHPEDRRATIVELTASGRRVAGRVRMTMDMVEDDALADLSPTVLRALRAGLDALGQVQP